MSPIIIEITGTTGSGKTTLIRNIISNAKKERLKIATADVLIIGKHFLSFIKGNILRSLIMDIIVVPYIFKKGNFKQISFYCKNIFKSQDSIIVKLNTFRNVIKRMGIYYKLLKIRQNLDLDFILLDEGLLHIAHNILVHEEDKPDIKELNKFLDSVPLYDRIVLLNATSSYLISTIKERKHLRVSSENRSIINFINNANIVFNEIKQNDRIKPLLFQIDRTSLDIQNETDSLMTFLKQNNIYA